MSDERRYSETEFALILRKAAELSPPVDRSGSAEGGHEGGLTLDEMKSIAAEVGLDPALVERATSLLPRQSSSSTLERVIGGPTNFRLEHVVRGGIDEDDVPLISNAIRAGAEHHGTLETNAAGIEWSSIEETARMHVTVSREGDSTRVVVTGDRKGGLVVTGILGALATTMVGIGVLVALEGFDVGSAAIGWPIFLGSIGASLATARAIWSRGTRTMQDRLQRIMEGVVGAVEREEQHPEQVDPYEPVTGVGDAEAGPVRDLAPE